MKKKNGEASLKIEENNRENAEYKSNCGSFFLRTFSFNFNDVVNYQVDSSCGEKLMWNFIDELY